MEYVHQIVHRTRSNKINNYKIVHQDRSQGRTNDLMNTHHWLDSMDNTCDGCSPIHYRKKSTKYIWKPNFSDKYTNF